ncbi:MAG: hypothetical protein ACM3ZV_06970 [Bacillota bacterium]
MSRLSVLAAGVGAAVVGATVYAAAPAASSGPVATYWMDVATQSGMGAGMMGGARPSTAQIMAMMNGGGGQAVRTLDLRLASKQKPAGAPEADHLIPQGLQMGASLPLLTPAREETPEAKPDGMPANFQRPKGRMLIYWGCGEHVAAGEPTVIDFSKIEPGKVPPGMAAFASMARTRSGPTSAPGFGRWPNERDSRQVPVSGSLLGAHKVEANYAPPIAFSLGAGQDFMPALGLREAGALASGASRLAWQQAPTATGYALALFGANEKGDVVMWSSAKSAQMPAMDYLAPAEVKKLVAAGSVLPPSANECVLPAEVAAASRSGMVMMIGYGPEADFSDNPKAPKWATKVRFKTTASLIRGMGDYGGYAARDEDAPPPQQPQRQQPPKKRRIGIGDLLGAIPHP